MESNSFWNKGYVHVLLTLILIAILVALAAYAKLTFMQAKGTFTGETTITVNGEGEVLAKPDIGHFSFAVRAEGADANEAQEASAESVNGILEYLKEAGVEEKDIKTQYYNLNPKYRYEERACPAGSFCPPGERVLDGYEVNQNVSVKVRDLDTAGDLISGVGERGATNISGLSFTIDDESVLKAEARAEAIADAKEKARELADDLGMKVGRIIGFNEDGGYYHPTAYSRGFGGDFDMAIAESAAAPSPELPTGENTISSFVSITYELR